MTYTVTGQPRPSVSFPQVSLLMPLQYLPLKRNYLQQQYALAEKRKGIEVLVGEILFLGKWSRGKGY